MYFEDLYNVGFRGLVMLKEEHEESPSGRDDDYDETYAALDPQGHPVKVSAHWHHNIFKPRTWDITHREPISREEYDDLVLARGVEDKPEWLREKAKEKRLAEQREQLREEAFPNCPKCRRQMVLRQNGKNKTWFFGCPKYSDCTGTRPMPADLYSKLKKLGMV